MSLYSPLHCQRDIRLLRMHSAPGASIIAITFEAYNLDSDVQYTALSYVWGLHTPPSFITCNGQRTPITPNLWDVLFQLQNEAHEGLVWVDAICINQRDNEEKANQVSMMRDIYKRAANVIFWLGKQEQYDRDAVRLMRVFCETHGYGTTHEFVSDLKPLRKHHLEELSLPTNGCGWYGWASLLSRPWFGRIWIVQEFANATRSIFMSGPLKIPTKLLIRCVNATAICASIGEAVSAHSRAAASMITIILRSYAVGLYEIVRSQAGDSSIRIFDLWTRSQLLEATDPRDRVFALLSTQTAVSLDLIDYNKTVENVYMEIATIALTMPLAAENWSTVSASPLPTYRCMSGPQRLSRFLACKAQTPHSSALPSWVPDWRPAGFNFVPLTRYYHGSTFFEHQYEHATICGKIMSISGLIADSPHVIIDSTPYMDVDRLYTVPTEGKNVGRLASWSKSMVNWLLMCRLVSEAWSPFATEPGFQEAFSRTMAFDSLPKDDKMTAAYYLEGYNLLHTKLALIVDHVPGKVLTHPSHVTATMEGLIYEKVFRELSAGRKCCVTSKGSMAWVPANTKLGDSICFLAGCAVPFVIRPVGESFELLGDCYLHDIHSDESITFTNKPRLLKFR